MNNGVEGRRRLESKKNTLSTHLSPFKAIFSQEYLRVDVDEALQGEGHPLDHGNPEAGRPLEGESRRVVDLAAKFKCQ